MRRLTIRRGREADIAACARIVAGDPLWRRYGLTLSGARTILREAIGLRTARSRPQQVTDLAVATWRGKVVGFVMYELRGTFHHSGYVRWIAVAPEARDRGVGQALMRRAEARIFRLGPNVFLTVSHFNTRAQAFYRKLGYRLIGAIPSYVRAGITERLYRKTRGPIDRRKRESRRRE